MGGARRSGRGKRGVSAELARAWGREEKTTADYAIFAEFRRKRRVASKRRRQRKEKRV